MKQGWEKTLLIHMPDKGLAPRTKTLITRQITRFLKNGQMTESDSPKQNTRDGRCALEKISTPEVTGETQNKTRTRRVAQPPEWLKRNFKKRSDAEPWRGRRAVTEQMALAPLPGEAARSAACPRRAGRPLGVRPLTPALRPADGP